MSVAPRRGGRPRSPQIDDAVLRATLALLEEVGFSGTTIQAVSRRSGVAPPAIYRRWANRVELIETAVFPELQIVAVSPSGDLRADLQSYVDAYTSAFSRPATRNAIPALLSEYQRDPASNRSVALRVGTTVRDAFRALIESQPPGTLAPDLDSDFVLDLLIGSVLYRTFILPFTGRRVTADTTAEVIHQALTCRRA
jgi:AcrR family transcriptional regulator